MVLPSFCEATDVLPVKRDPNEFNEFIELFQHGGSSLGFGPGVLWDDLQPSGDEIGRRVEQDESCDGSERHAEKAELCNRVMEMIATLVPEEKRGPYAFGEV